MARNCSFITMVMLVLLSACGHAPARSHVHTHAGGEDVAATLNTRYEDVRSACDDGASAAYFCTGVLVRVANLAGPYHFWNPNPGDEYYGVSFSYFRKDVGSRELFGTGAGYVLAPADGWGKGGYYRLEMKCSFSYDAITSLDRGPYGCGASAEYPIDSRPCFVQGILTVPAFEAHYLSVAPEPENPPDAFRRRALHQCSFGVDPFSFELSILARQGGRLEIPMRRYMELMIAEWPQDIPQQLPIEAIFYRIDRGAEGIAEARKGQADYRAQTGIVLPILRLHMGDDEVPFTYDDSDQGSDVRAAVSQ